MKNSSTGFNEIIKMVSAAIKQWFKKNELAVGLDSTIVNFDSVSGHSEFSNGELIVCVARTKVPGSKKHIHTLDIVVKQLVYENENMEIRVDTAKENKTIILHSTTVRKLVKEISSHVSNVLAEVNHTTALPFDDPETRKDSTKVMNHSYGLYSGSSQTTQGGYGD